MLNGLYERIAGEPNGLRRLAGARLRRRAIVVLHQALSASGLSQSDLAKKLGIRRSAVNQVFRGDGNVRMETIAEYLHELGFELDVQLVAAGEPRRAATERAAGLRHEESASTSSGPIDVRFLLGDVLVTASGHEPHPAPGAPSPGRPLSISLRPTGWFELMGGAS